jgi:hypothetical protein
MVSSGMLRRAALVSTDVSEELRASFTRVTRIGELGTTLGARRLVVPAYVPSSPILVTPMMEALSSSETSVLTRATRRNIPEDGIQHARRSTCNEKCYCRCDSSFVNRILMCYETSGWLPLIPIRVLKR